MKLSTRRALATLVAFSVAAGGGVATASAETTAPETTAPGTTTATTATTATTTSQDLLDRYLGRDAVDDTVPYDLPVDTTPAELARSAGASTTSHSLRVVVIKRPGAPSDAQVQSLVKDVSAFWSKQSRGKVTFSVKGAITRMSTSARCTTTDGIVSMWSAASKKISGGKDWTRGTYGPAAREHLVVLYPYSAGDSAEKNTAYNHTCDSTLGLGNAPSKASTAHNGLVFALYGGPDGASTSQYYEARQTLAHELGHNLGLMHSNLWWCPSGASDGALSSASCSNDAYFDPLDVMGGGFGQRGDGFGKAAPDAGSAPSLSAPQKLRLGLIPSAQRRSATASTSVTLTPNGQTKGTQVVSVLDPTTKDTYYLELQNHPSLTYRAHKPSLQHLPWTFDLGDGGTPLYYTITTGVRVLRVAPSNTADYYKNEQFVTPVKADGQQWSALPAGQTFTTRSKSVSIKLTEQTDTAAKLSIVIRRPAVSLKRSGTQRYAQSAATFSATVGAVEGKAATGTVTFRSGSSTVGKATVKNGKATVRASTTALKPGKRTVTATFTPDSASKKRGVSPGTASTPVSVLKAKSATSVRLSPAKVKHGSKAKKAKAVVTIKVAGIAKPGGTVKVYVSGKHVKTVKLTSHSKGKVTVTLPRKTKKGTYAVKVTYSGTSTTSGATSKTVKLRVY